MKKKAIFGWFAGLALLVCTCFWTKSSAEPYMTDFDDGCTGSDWICGVVDG